MHVNWNLIEQHWTDGDESRECELQGAQGVKEREEKKAEELMLWGEWERQEKLQNS